MLLNDNVANRFNQVVLLQGGHLGELMRVFFTGVGKRETMWLLVG